MGNPGVVLDFYEKLADVSEELVDLLFLQLRHVDSVRVTVPGDDDELVRERGGIFKEILDFNRILGGELALRVVEEALVVLLDLLKGLEVLEKHLLQVEEALVFIVRVDFNLHVLHDVVSGVQGLLDRFVEEVLFGERLYFGADDDLIRKGVRIRFFHYVR